MASVKSEERERAMDEPRTKDEKRALKKALKKMKKLEKKKRKRDDEVNEEKGDGDVKKKKKEKKEKKKEKKKKKKSDGKNVNENEEKTNATQEKKTSSEMNKKMIESRREELGVTVSFVATHTRKKGDEEDRAPCTSFEESGVDSRILNVACSGFTSPTPIQSQCLPFLLRGHDLVGVAATGSGKTMAYVLPALMRCCATANENKGGGGGGGGGGGDGSMPHRGSSSKPMCLVLAPTRELVQQIHGEVERCAPGTEGMLGKKNKDAHVQSAVVYGGVPKPPQVRALRQPNLGVVVATPGRLIDLLHEGAVKLDGVEYLVLDEADRMLDLGFEKDIRAIVGETSKARQTLMFSATWPESVEKLAAEFLSKTSHVRVTIGSTTLAASHTVKQIVEVLKPEERDRRLLSILKNYHRDGNRILIFVLYKKEAPRVESMLARSGLRCIGISGDKSQADRNRAVEQFKSGETPLLVATDVAARGLDIEGVEYVINYSFPLTSEDYVHRIGRTGRAGKSGVAHTFFTINDKARSGELVNVLREAGQDVPPDLVKFGTTVKKKEHALYGAHFKEGAATKATKITFD